MTPWLAMYFLVTAGLCLGHQHFRRRFVHSDEKILHKTESYEIVGLILSQETLGVAGVKVLNNGKIEYEYIDGALDTTTKSVREKLPDELIATVDIDSSGKRRLIYSEAHNMPGRFHVFDMDNQSLKTVSYMYPEFKEKFDSSLIEGEVVNNEFEIRYLLNIPSKRSEQKYPLVVMPHGGPFEIFDNKYYDPVTLFLVANGFAVLRVNFRGSGGFTDEFVAAGKREWGGKMLEDIIAALRTVSARSDIDESRICAFGASYGGYASLMLAATYSEYFKCVASLAGVTDVNLYINDSHGSEARLEWKKEYIGDPDVQYDVLKAISPVFIADKIIAPVFLAHGTRDDIVNIEHAFRMKSMLEKNKKYVEWYLIDDQGHSFNDSEKKIKFYFNLLRFMQETIQ